MGHSSSGCARGSELPSLKEAPCPKSFSMPPGCPRSPATLPGFHAGRSPRNKGRRCPADPPTVAEIVAVMRHAGTSLHAARLRALIVVLWRAGLRIHEALALGEAYLDQRRGSVLVRRGEGGRRREVGMDDWAWERLQPWLSAHRASRRPAALRGRRAHARARVVSGRRARGAPPRRHSSRRTPPLRATSAPPRARRRDGPRGRPTDRHQRQLGHTNLGSPRSTCRGSTAPRSSTPSTPADRR
jgi:integrase